jgi:hypothetical protein
MPSVEVLSCCGADRPSGNDRRCGTHATRQHSYARNKHKGNTIKTHIDQVAIELLRHQVAKVDANCLTEQEGAVISNLNTCSRK